MKMSSANNGFDLVIRSGTVVDGTGRPPRTADVAVAGGVVVEVGRVSGTGSREIDADGAVVAPGFVDIHTHYDAQATWDSQLQPSSWHGVTTVVMGNCGVGFAPVRQNDHDRLVELMEGVEDIPGVAMHEGLTWEWNSFPDYLDALGPRHYDADIAAQVPHAALRVYAMGERAAAHVVATDDEVRTMAALAREAVEAGAIGFSTSRSLSHKSSAGELTPSYDASEHELVEIARAIGTTGKGVLQLVNNWPDLDADFGLMRAMAAVSGRSVSVTLAQENSKPDLYREILNRLTDANADGFAIRGQVAVRPVGFLLGLQCTVHPLIMNSVWIDELSLLPVAEQARRMRDPELKARIVAAQTDAQSTTTVIGSKWIQVWDRMFELGALPNYEPAPQTCIAAIAESTRQSPIAVAYDILSGDEGAAMLYVAATGYCGNNLDTTYEMLTHEWTVPGLSDGGAHVGTICDGSFPTTLLQHWVRDRERDRLDLSFAVKRQCRDTARAAGLLDRGQLTPGYKADINVIDLDNLQIRRPEMHFDLPAGGKRLLQRADGYKHTIVSGLETYRDGVATGELPGRLVRS